MATVTNPVKPHLSYQDQITLLQSRGMVIDSVPEALALLERVGYYRLAGYWYPFRILQQNVRGDTFLAGTNFSVVKDLYEFDKRLRLFALDAIERIEVALRVDIAYEMGKLDPMAHECPHLLDHKFCTVKDPTSGKTQFDVWIERYCEVCNDSREDFVLHHRKKYSGKMPIWVSTEVWNFGLLSRFFSGMRYANQQRIESRYRLPPGLLETWLRSINFVRNVAAHHSRMWNRNIADKPKLPKPASHPNLAHLVAHPAAITRLYGVLCLLKYLLRTVAPNSDWGDQLKAHCLSFPSSPHISLSHAGFPAGWESEQLWR